MQNINIGKTSLVVAVLLLGTLFFTDDIIKLYDHRNDLSLDIRDMEYTKKGFDSMDIEDKTKLVEEISMSCIRKHTIDKLSCSDTSYWLANSLEKKGVEIDLSIEWMSICIKSCETRKMPKMLLEKEIKSGNKKTKSVSKHTQWFWEN